MIQRSERDSRPVTIATVQPPFPTPGTPVEKTTEAALRLFDEALHRNPDVVCLPEYLNCMDFSSEPEPRWFAQDADALLLEVRKRAQTAACNAILPMVVGAGDRRFNRAFVIDRSGSVVGTFDKIHVTRVERDCFRVAGGRDWPVFDLDFGRIGIMICYDGCFSESSRILALAGAEILFWPSLQRSYTRQQLALQMQSHAYFNYVPVVRSSYAGPASADGESNGIVGLSGVCMADGTLGQALAHESGYVVAEIDLADGPTGSRTFGGEVGPLKQLRFEDRLPGMYEGITRLPTPSAPKPHFETAKSVKRTQE